MTTSIPSPPAAWQSFDIGPLTIHAYALFILAGIFFALWLTTRRWVERGGEAETVGEIALWAIPFGIIGGRIYHVISTPGPYFGEGGDPWAAFEIWNGGLGIWGAVALGALGAYIGARRHGASFTAFADAAAPAVLIAQAIGRLGNWFNQELFGRPTDVPWALEIDPAFRPEGYEQYATFQPTFLYELLWNVAGAVLIIWLDKRYDLRGGRVFWLYVIVYVSGRLWIETVRIDTAVTVGGLRINVWVSIAVLALGVAMFVLLGVRQRSIVDPVPRHLLAARVGADGARGASDVRSADAPAGSSGVAAEYGDGDEQPGAATMLDDGEGEGTVVPEPASARPAPETEDDDQATSQGKS
ncbi:prolipoprotein diacylglyceryl transferase [Demequina sp. NBRC 110053]|uniref:prolipoprotein diacylglyceryl transferase n=1 Tax=Demequina sp. NBRC 110053 TaxID=1570342 RepID=UPI0009FE5735|nr:prolipoprotein diacylglyceryl transferase [Demequina sp. NBRC 110053]